MFDYDSLMKDATYKGTYVRNADDPDDPRNETFTGKFLGMNPEQLLKIAKNPDSKARQVALLCDDPKYGKAIRYFDPETLILVED